MYTKMEQPLQIITDFISNCLEKELKENGLLSDIKSYKRIFRDEVTIKTPAVWLYMRDWSPSEEYIINRNNTRIEITFPVEVACISHKKTLDKSDREATSIQGRVIESFVQNWRRNIDSKYNISCLGFRLIQGYTDGSLEKINQRDTTTIKGVLVEFKFMFDWMRCLKIFEENMNEKNQTENTDLNNTNNNGG